jgi:hypothetical protein
MVGYIIYFMVSICVGFGIAYVTKSIFGKAAKYFSLEGKTKNYLLKFSFWGSVGVFLIPFRFRGKSAFIWEASDYILSFAMKFTVWILIILMVSILFFLISLAFNKINQKNKLK